jgi:hypothetical protein
VPCLRAAESLHQRAEIRLHRRLRDAGLRVQKPLKYLGRILPLPVDYGIKSNRNRYAWGTANGHVGKKRAEEFLIQL